MTAPMYRLRAQGMPAIKPSTSPPARVHFTDGRVRVFQDPRLAYLTWLCPPRGWRVAFRGKGDNQAQ